MDRHRRLFRAVLVAYPAAFRREYGDAMTQLFLDRLRSEGGGARTILIWTETFIDLGKSAFVERMETAVRSLGTNWWGIASVPLAMFIALAGVGNVFQPEDTAGPNWQIGAIAYAAAALVGPILVVSGLAIRRRNRMLGSSMIAVGMMPGFPMTVMFWFPPVALVGLLSIAISTIAFIDAPKAPQSVMSSAS